ncbi:class I SAM-dependent methyltransferase, partial [bacterium]|nr:class I SAM-dependent methyltransferase [bacterium]
MTQKQEIFSLMGGRVKMHRGRYNPTSDAVWLAAYGAGRGARDILDVGVGTGGVALCIMAHAPDVNITAIDVSPEMLAEFSENSALNQLSPEIINADITTWRTDRRFDLVIT